MNLKILFILLMYYSLISAIFILGGNTLTDSGYNFTNPINSSELADNEVDTGGLFGTGISFGRFFGLVTIGVGIPDTEPLLFRTLIMVWQTIMLVFTIGFVMESIWSG